MTEFLEFRDVSKHFGRVRAVDHVSYLCPNKASYEFLGEEIKGNKAVFPDPEVRAKGEMILDLGPENVKYTKVWDQIKAAE